MIPNEAKNLLQDILTIEMFEMQRALDESLNATMARLAAAGALHSGRALLLMAQDGTNSLKSRGWYILGQLLRSLAAYKTPMSPETVTEASRLLNDWIEREAQLITNLVFNKPAFHTATSQGITRELRGRFAQEAQRLTSRLSSEIKLSAATAQTPKENGQTLTFNAPIGLVQVGDGNQVNVYQHIGAGLRNEISLALQALLQRLDQSEEVISGNRAELRQLVEEAKAEVEKREGNSLKLGTTLRGIAETAKVVGSLSDFYQTLKPLLSQIGIHLP